MKYQPVSVVAVVGIGHVPGIVSNWDKRISTVELLTYVTIEEFSSLSFNFFCLTRDLH